MRPADPGPDATVWVGLDIDPSNCETHIKLIFETMIFLAPEAEDKYLEFDVYQQRYPTEASAQAGHDQAVTWAQDTWFMNAKEDITNDHPPTT